VKENTCNVITFQPNKGKSCYHFSIKKKLELFHCFSFQSYFSIEKKKHLLLNDLLINIISKE